MEAPLFTATPFAPIPTMPVPATEPPPTPPDEAFMSPPAAVPVTPPVTPPALAIMPPIHWNTSVTSNQVSIGHFVRLIERN